ncbi:MAG: YHS domain-containing protein [Patescibacteria group bacterium]
MNKTQESRRSVGLSPNRKVLPRTLRFSEPAVRTGGLLRRELVTDPVCGMEKPRSEMRVELEYKGKTYYFCTDGDKKMFEAYPENWIPKEARDTT